MESDQKRKGSLQLIVNRLYSHDANDRVKAAAELGEVGTPKEAPELLKVAYEDEASTVRQMAIQAYAEILENEGIEEIVKAAKNHFDDYVRLYAITVLGRLDTNLVSDVLSEFLNEEDPKLAAAAIRAMIHAETRENVENIFQVLTIAEKDIIIRNCIEALALWKSDIGEDFVRSNFYEREENYSLEIKTISAFYLAVLGDKKAYRYLENEELDSYVRLIIDDKRFGGRKGLLEAVDYLR